MAVSQSKEINDNLKPLANLPKPTKPRKINLPVYEWCLECGNDLPAPTRKGGNPRRFCSPKCSRSFERAREKDKQPAKNEDRVFATLKRCNELGIEGAARKTLLDLALMYPMRVIEMVISAILDDRKLAMDRIIKEYQQHVEKY